MLDIRTILHPTDFSEHSEDAFHLACALARDYRARVVVLYVMPVGTVQVVALSQMGTQENTGNIRESFLHDLRKFQPHDPAVKVEHRLEDGDAVKGILRVAREIHANLIIMGTHGRSGLSHMLMGSVADRVVHRAECPVLTVSKPAKFVESQMPTEPQSASESVQVR